MEKQFLVMRSDNCGIMAPIKELDSKNVEEFRSEAEKLIKDKVNDIIVDFSLVKYIDSSGIGALLSVVPKLQDHRGKLVLCGINPYVASIFRETNLDSFFEIYTDRDDAKINL